MERRILAVFARELRKKIEVEGAGALERTDWAERLSEFGFEMDCGHSFEQRYGLVLGDADRLKREIARIDDVQVLGNAVFSQCRYITHWAMSPCSREIEWLTLALVRLEGISRMQS